MQNKALIASALGFTCYLGYSKMTEANSTVALTQQSPSAVVVPHFTLNFDKGNDFAAHIVGKS